MGETRVKVGILALTRARRKAVEVECIVDTGATLTTLPAVALARAKVAPNGRIQLHLADGRKISRRCGWARLLLDGELVFAKVVFGARTDPALLGVAVLEHAGLLVDPVCRRLLKRGFYQQFFVHEVCRES